MNLRCSQLHPVCVDTMSVLDEVLASHSMLCDSALVDCFIDKNPHQHIMDRILNVALRKLSEDDFKNGVMRLIELNTEKMKQDPYGKFFYVDTDIVKVPAVYDLLCKVFLRLDNNARVKSFHDITEKYYNIVMSKHGLTKEQFRMQTRLFLPYAKLEKLYQSCNQKNVADIQRAALEVEECILYPDLSREECCVILRNIYECSEVDLISFDVILAEDLPGNLGKYFKIRLTARIANETRTHQLFAKMIDENNELMSEFARLPFRKERFFFETMLTHFKEFGIGRLTDFCPKCYFARSDMLVFEDISVNGYSSWNYQIPVSYQWLTTIVNILAKLHGASLILEEKLSEKLGRTVRLDEEYSDGLCEAGFIDKEEYTPFRDCYRRSIYGYLLSKFSEVPQRIQMDALRENVKEALEKMYEVIRKSDKIRNVFNHGDLWTGNIMYKDDSEPSAYLIDFQLTRYCPPSVDLMFLLYSNTDRTTRLKYLEELIDLYYTELSQILRSYDIDIGNIFSFDQLRKSCKEVEPMVICTALMYGENMLMPVDHRKEMHSDKEREKHFLTIDKAPELEKAWEHRPFKIRIEGLIEDIIHVYEDEM